MNANETIREALAQEGILVTEQDLIRATLSKQQGVAQRPLKDLAQANETSKSPIETATDWSSYGQPRPGIKGRMPWYSAALCGVGMHRGQWIYMAHGLCTQIRECERCGAIRVRTKHQREWRYTRNRQNRPVGSTGAGIDIRRQGKAVKSAATCDQVRICGRCDAVTGNRIKHEKWSAEWDTGSDTRAHRCLRCGVVESWSVADYD